MFSIFEGRNFEPRSADFGIYSEEKELGFVLRRPNRGELEFLGIFWALCTFRPSEAVTGTTAHGGGAAGIWNFQILFECSYEHLRESDEKRKREREREREKEGEMRREKNFGLLYCDPRMTRHPNPFRFVVDFHELTS